MNPSRALPIPTMVSSRPYRTVSCPACVSSARASHRPTVPNPTSQIRSGLTSPPVALAPGEHNAGQPGTAAPSVEPGTALRPGRGCDALAVTDVLRRGFPGTLGVMGHPHPGTSGHGQHEHGRQRHGQHDHDHGHEHAARRGAGGRAWHLLRPHSHEPAQQVDAALEASAEGMRVLWVSLAVLAGTAATQAAVAAVSGSVALLGDTLHNAADALTAVPLGIAFVVGRRPPNRRYTYGYGRAEDLAGVVIVLLIAASSALAGWQAVTRLAHPHPVSNLMAVAIAAVIGFAGNELVARYRIRVGRKIGSAALVADGLHARTDGFTSLAVLLGA